jgi:hypothetical protein
MMQVAAVSWLGADYYASLEGLKMQLSIITARPVFSFSFTLKDLNILLI